MEKKVKAEIVETGEIIEVEISEDGKSIIVDAKTYRKMMSYAPAIPLLPFSNDETAKFSYEITISNPLPK